MPAPYPIDLRYQILLAYRQKEGSLRQLAVRFKVSKTFIVSLLEQVNKIGTVDPKPHGGGRTPVINAYGENFIKRLLENQPNLTMGKICREYNKYFKPVSCSTIARTLVKIKKSRKSTSSQLQQKSND